MAIINKNRKINPLDINKDVTIGVRFPLNDVNMFKGTQTFKEQVKSNLLNLLLTNPGERFMNPKFGIGIRKFLFENIISKEVLRQKIQDGIIKYIPEINLTNLVMGRESMDTTPEIHMFKIHIAYRVLRENSMDAVEVNFN